jgi:hypothetical protein
MADDYQPQRRSSCTWPELLNLPHRKMLLKDFLFTTGVTTFVGPSGGGKTTTAMALTVATGGIWGDDRTEQMPVFWIAAQGQEDLRAMYEAAMQKRPGCGVPQGRIFGDAIDSCVRPCLHTQSPSENREADLIDWLANSLSRAGAAVASWFVSQDAPNFDFFSGLMAVLLLATIVLTIVFSQSLLDYWRSHR